jgi:hypothetical protein
MDITSFAVDLYWMFSSSELADELKNNANHIKEGAKEVKNGALRCKARTMHYFNHKNRFKPKQITLFGLRPIFTLYPTSEHSLRHYVQELRKDISDGVSMSTYHLIGKIMHLVQDMSSPANVIPVFHGPSGGDSFESRLNYRMGSYLSGFNYNQERFNLVTECSVGENCIENIYHGAAIRTREHITSPKSQFNIEIDGETRKVGWDLFWKGEEQMNSSPKRYKLNGFKGFGSYGPLGKHFGQEQVDIARNRYVVNSKIYDELCSFVVRKTIEDSLKILICVDNQIQRSRLVNRSRYN